jgi:periplasmic protein TonB
VKRRLFEDLIVSARGKRGDRAGFAVPASVGIHAAIVGGAILLSVFGPSELLPEATARPGPILVPTFPVAPPITPSKVRVAPPSRAGRHGGGIPGVPRPAPAVAVGSTGPPEPDLADMEPEPGGCLGPDCDLGAPPGPSTDDLGTGGGGSGPPSTVRASVDVAPPVKLRNVDPVYPELARRAGVEGVVIIECTIDPKGRIAGARVLRGNPLLDGAALDAVQRWQYTPSLLNGAPVSVIMTVTVNFRIPR